MRKFFLCVLTGVLAALVAARALLPETAGAAAEDGAVYGYNICNISLPITVETAGSALIAEMNGYYLFQTPTAKNEWTGVFHGKNLIVLCADGWNTPKTLSRSGDGALYRVSRGSAEISSVYRTDWFQGSAGLLFALLTGVPPTTVNDMSALTYAGDQDIYFPYTLARCLSQEGYVCSAFIRDANHREGMETLGFENVTVTRGAAEETILETLEAAAAEKPFFAFWLWEDEDCGAALDALYESLKSGRLLDKTVICLLTGADGAEQGRLYIYGAEAANAASARPCSALDVTPTLLNLFGLTYDSRFLTGTDVFSTNSETGVVRAVTPAVSLYGSAFSDWVSDAGSYSSGGSIFRQTADCFDSSEEVSAYVHEVSRLVYERYTYAYKTMENNYFRLVVTE